MTEQPEKYTTLCEHCYFATYNDNKQIGCEIGRLEKFKEKDLVESTGDFFTIQSICNTCRPKDWAENKENPEIEVWEEVKIRVDAIVVSKQQKDATNKIVHAAKQCKKQKLKPQRVVFIIDNKEIDFKELHAKINDVLSDSIQFQIMHVFVDTRSYEDMIDEAFRRCKSTYYMQFEAGKDIDENLLNKCNDLINKDLVKFSYADFSDKKGNVYYIAQSLVHRMLVGNRQMSLKEKIKILSKEQKLEKMLIEI